MSAVFHSFYKFRESVGENRLASLPDHIADEILTAALMLPLTEANLRWPVSTVITCSDATPSTDAYVSCGVSGELTATFYDSCVTKGTNVKMTDDLVSRLRAQMLFPEDDVIREVCTCMPSKLSEVRHHAHLLHVNLREFDGMALVTRRAAAFSTFPLRMTNGSDSEVTIGAACKGRSPSHQLNTRMRKFAARSILGCKKQAHFKIGTKDNPADDPT